MKSVAVLLIFVAVSYAYEGECRDNYLKKTFEKCLAANGGDKVHVFDVLNLKNARNEDGECFRACLMKKCSYFSDGHKLNDDAPQRMAYLLHDGDANKFRAIEQAATVCVSQQIYEGNECRDIENFTRCFIKQCTTCGLDLRSLIEGWNDEEYLYE